jgi:hypothetical protein
MRTAPLNSGVRLQGDQLSTVETLRAFMLAVTLTNGIVVLFLQVKALRKHRHHSFCLLALATVVALLSFGVLFIPHFVPEVSNLSALIASTSLYALYAVLGVWGTASLFRSYGALRQAPLIIQAEA